MDGGWRMASILHPPSSILHPTGPASTAGINRRHEAGPLVILWTRKKGRGVGAGRGAAEAGLPDQVLERRGPGA